MTSFPAHTNVLEQFTASNLENLDVVHLFGFTGADEQSFKSRWSTRDNFMTLLLRQLSKLPVQVEYLLPEVISNFAFLVSDCIACLA
jgi:hypothetical protein